MDLAKLLEPYSDGGLRTVEAQIKWLTGKGIPRNHIDQAILTVYDEMERGRAFEDGHQLDQELLRAAQNSHQAELSESVAKLESFFNELTQRHRNEAAAEVIARMQRPLNWLQRFGKWLFRL